jgi:biotin carboxyl carrier protein
MRQNYQVEGELRAVEWERLQLPYALKLGEETVSVVHHRPGFCLLADGRCLRYTSVYAAGAGEWTITTGLQGQPITLKPQRGERRQADNGSGGVVRSPMNGVVVKVAASVGDSVEAGAVIVVLEAMKMENEVTAPVAGKLARCEVTQGQTVSANDLMFEVEP